ncbi:hypothetical protein [Roseateles sp. P5_D6]
MFYLSGLKVLGRLSPPVTSVMKDAASMHGYIPTTTMDCRRQFQHQVLRARLGSKRRRQDGPRLLDVVWACMATAAG